MRKISFTWPCFVLALKAWRFGSPYGIAYRLVSRLSLSDQTSEQELEATVLRIIRHSAKKVTIFHLLLCRDAVFLIASVPCWNNAKRNLFSLFEALLSPFCSVDVWRWNRERWAVLQQLKWRSLWTRYELVFLFLSPISGFSFQFVFVLPFTLSLSYFNIKNLVLFFNVFLLKLIWISDGL